MPKKRPPNLYHLGLSLNGRLKFRDVMQFDLPEIGLKPKARQEMHTAFLGLTTPLFIPEIANRWFTQEGIDHFGPSIEALRLKLRKRGWRIVWRTLPDTPETRNYAVHESTDQLFLTCPLPIEYHDDYPARTKWLPNRAKHADRQTFRPVLAKYDAHANMRVQIVHKRHESLIWDSSWVSTVPDMLHLLTNNHVDMANACRVAWVGDHLLGEKDVEVNPPAVFDRDAAIWGILTEITDTVWAPSEVMTYHGEVGRKDIDPWSGFLVNLDKKIYIDLALYKERGDRMLTDAPQEPGVKVLHPLPLLTAVGCRGHYAGDYTGGESGFGLDDLGSWAFDIISYTMTPPGPGFSCETNFIFEPTSLWA